MTENVKLRPENERLRALLRRSEALNFAYGALLGEQWDSAQTKAEMLETLEEICVEAHELFESYKRKVCVYDCTV